MGEKKKPLFKFKCTFCKASDTTHGSLISGEQTVCPTCENDTITKWIPPQRGRPKLGKKQVSYDLPLNVIQLAKDRAKRDGVAICDAVAQSILEANSTGAEKMERQRLKEWRALRFVDSRELDASEQETFKELFRLAAKGEPVPPEAFEDETIRLIKDRLEEAQSAQHLPTSLADDYTTVLCGILSSKPSEASLWAFTLYDIYRNTNNIQTVTLNVWVKCFAAGIPTEESFKALWQEQKVFLNGTTLRNYTEMPAEWIK